MRSKIIFTLLCSTLLSTQVLAGLPEAMDAFDMEQYSIALPEFTYLADEGNDVANYYLGVMYKQGLGVAPDTARAVKYLTASANAYNADASYMLGKMMIDGDGVTADMEKGLLYLKKAAFGGSSEALYELGEIFAGGIGGEQVNNINAFGYYLLAALRGNMKAQLRLSKFFLEGKGTPQDYEKALKWLSRSANQGYVAAQRDMAELRSSNPHMANLQDAYMWYSIIAAYNTDEIGTWARERRDQLAVSPEFRNVAELVNKQREASAWRPTPASKSVPPEEFSTTPVPVIPGFNDPQTIQLMLAGGDILLTDGTEYGITSDLLQQAMSSGDWSRVNDLIELAAKKGNVTAYTFMGDFMAKRMNDEAAAAKWYLRGANAGDGYAQYQISKMYCEGRGVEHPDVPMCYKWLLLASDNVGKSLKFSVQNALAAVEKKATAEELKAGRLLAEGAEVNKGKKAAVTEKTGFSLF